MSQIENNSNNMNTSNSMNSNTTHFQARNINLNFMKELFKKNAILYIAILFAIPALGLLFAIINEGEGYYSRITPVLDINELIAFTILVMITVPAILSITLFSWVYKRKKVDFICSMPINRRTMCMSTTILGVAIIVVISFLYTSFIGLGGAVSGKFFFIRQLVDTFVYMLLAMLFFFGICNLAMSRAGNIITQGVLILLLILFIPLFYYMFKEAGSGGRYTFFGESNSPIYLYNYVHGNEYLPIPLNSIFGTETKFLSAEKIAQTLIYIAVTYVLTQVLFEHRKMEENQESFKSTLIHEIVKVLTLIIPLSVIAKEIFDDDIEIPTFLIINIIILVYFVIYDLITSKKVKLKYSAIALVCVYVITSVFGFVLYKLDNVNYEDSTNISVNSIKTISFQIPYSSEWFEITDEKCISEFIDYVRRYEISRSRSYSWNDYSSLDKDIEWEEDKLEANTQTSTRYAKIIYRIKLENNKEFTLSSIYTTEKNFNTIFAKYLDQIKGMAVENIKNNSGFWEKSRERLYGNSASTSYKTYKAKKENEISISEILKEIDKKSVFELFDSIYWNGDSTQKQYNGFCYQDFIVYEVDINNYK